MANEFSKTYGIAGCNAQTNKRADPVWIILHAHKALKNLGFDIIN